MPDTMESLICEENLSCAASASGAADPMPTPGADVARPIAAIVALGRARQRGVAAMSPLRPQLFVTVLEAGEDGLLVRWVESGRCHYGEQRWRLRAALAPGRCAISGRPIEPGEPVFRPVRRPVPANADEMIRPASVPKAFGAVRDAVPDEDHDAGHDATEPAGVAG
ncbi:DUF3331 domain-containing protein [Burkholderia cepacia]|uniref:Ribosomal protein S14 n=1 Tax=Burkholderia cepacia GG4 TaxID=1009846 RepID=A0A9W3K3M1_BURCE|nr:DUF3331 domain-containing protein [Burkholderia cepacia]AFQ50327.1 hypothetical protein GEM_3937 [Burkholderia cepacia GG4]